MRKAWLKYCGFLVVLATGPLRIACADPTFELLTSLDPVDPGSTSYFGCSLAISGDTLVVGDRANNGSAYVFEYLDGIWTTQQVLTASNAQASDNFGCSVGISGDLIIVGAKWEDSAATGINGNQSDNSLSQAGAAYVFIRTNGVWQQEAYLKPSNQGMTRAIRFGSSVAASGNRVIVGAPNENCDSVGVNGDDSSENWDVAGGSGAAYVFLRENGQWSQEAYIKAFRVGFNFYFGDSVGMS